MPNPVCVHYENKNYMKEEVMKRSAIKRKRRERRVEKGEEDKEIERGRNRRKCLSPFVAVIEG